MTLAADDPFSLLFAEMKQEMLKASPNLDGYMQKLKNDLAAMPELVWKLTDEQIGDIVSGLSIVSRIAITSSTGGKKVKSDAGALASALDMISLESGGQMPKALTAAESKQAADAFANLDLSQIDTTKGPTWRNRK